jgi:hypothetical protein
LFSGSYLNGPLVVDGGTLLVWTNGIGITSVEDAAGANWPFRLVAISGTNWCYAIPFVATASYGASTGLKFQVNFASAVTNGWYAWVLGTPFLPKLGVQQVDGNWTSPYLSFTVPYPHKVKAVTFTVDIGAAAVDFLMGLGSGSGFGPPGVFSGTSGQALAANTTYNVSMSAGVPVNGELSVTRNAFWLAGTDIVWPANTAHTGYCNGATVTAAIMLVDPA